MNVDLRFPIGKVQFVRNVSDAQRSSYIDAVAKTPARLREAVAGLNPAQLDEPYRPEGWTVRQVVHHLPDSHMNAFIRFKLALTEDVPTIKPYDEARWAELPDARAEIEPSLNLLENLHKRWDVLLRGMASGDFARKFNHPEAGTMTLDDYLQVYAWHGRHHVAHITSLREREGW
jgi:DinB superfamily